MITNIFDFIVDKNGEFDDKFFHIPVSNHYEEVGFPFYVDHETHTIMDNNDEPAVLTVEMIDSIHWEIIDD